MGRARVRRGAALVEEGEVARAGALERRDVDDAAFARRARRRRRAGQGGDLG